MTAQFLADLEAEMLALVDEMEWNWQAEKLRAISRKVAVELELTRLRERQSRAA